MAGDFLTDSRKLETNAGWYNAIHSSGGGWEVKRFFDPLDLGIEPRADDASIVEACRPLAAGILHLPQF
jgi:hypothetical protein